MTRWRRQKPVRIQLVTNGQTGGGARLIVDGRDISKHVSGIHLSVGVSAPNQAVVRFAAPDIEVLGDFEMDVVADEAESE